MPLSIVGWGLFAGAIAVIALQVEALFAERDRLQKLINRNHRDLERLRRRVDGIEVALDDDTPPPYPLDVLGPGRPEWTSHSRFN